MDEMLKFAVENGMIDLSYMQDVIEMRKRKELLDKHPYSVWEGKDGKWYTYLPDETKERKKALRKRASREEIEELIVDYWRTREEKERVYSFDDVYFMWRNVQDQTVSENTVAKYETDYARFFKDTEFASMDIAKVDDDAIRIFMCSEIKEHRLQREGARKLFGYIANTVYFARKKRIVSGNPVEFLQPKDFYRHCYDVYKPDEKKIISKEDMRALQQRFQMDYESRPNYIPTYAVEFASLTGMRVGEIAALRWDAITDDYIVIDKSEKSNRAKTDFWIDRTKNGKNRLFPMTDEICGLLKRIETVEKEYGYFCEWVFANEKGRVHAPIISSCSKTKCRQLGIDEKGIHAYRKTLNSNLRCRGVSATVASSMLGHSMGVNERYYTFDITENSERARIVSEVNRETLRR